MDLDYRSSEGAEIALLDRTLEMLARTDRGQRRVVRAYELGEINAKHGALREIKNNQEVKDYVKSLFGVKGKEEWEETTFSGIRDLEHAVGGRQRDRGFSDLDYARYYFLNLGEELGRLSEKLSEAPHIEDRYLAELLDKAKSFEGNKLYTGSRKLMELVTKINELGKKPTRNFFKIRRNKKEQKSLTLDLVSSFLKGSDDKSIDVAYDSIARIDELNAYDSYAESLPVASLPTVVDSPKHFFRATNLVNGVTAIKNRDYTPNDVELDENRIAFLTGPNTGGKTSLVKSIVYAQLLAQKGCYVPAESATVSVADRIFLFTGEPNSIHDAEGSFGRNMSRAREIVFGSTPRSLVIVDDLIEGTRPQERDVHIRNILQGLYHKEPTVVYITHDDSLVDDFAEVGAGEGVEMEFDGTRPTYKLKKGIARNSHSDLVARRVGLDKDSIVKHLMENGHIQSADEFDILRK
ncbi:MAG: hypothetical protein AABX23_03905 [Nanoarchaeota archaeon]